MSLINDALKRATKGPTAPRNPGESGEPMRPADSHQSVALPRYFFPVLLCIFCGAMWFIMQGWDARRQAVIQPEIVQVHAREAGSPTAATVQAGSEPALTAAQEPADDNQAIPANRDFDLDDAAASASVNPATGSAPAAPAQALRLQGIFYRTSRPSAVINAQSVFIGDHVSGARVKAIDRGSVTLERDGRTQILTLH